MSAPSHPEQSTEVTASQSSVEVPIEVLRYKEELASKMGLPSPYGMSLLKQYCEDLVASGMVPSYFNKNPMAVYTAAMRGREMGLDPTESIMETFWPAPGGKLGIYANKLLDLLHRGGVTSKFICETRERCEILFTPPNKHEPYTAVFDFSEAVSAGLVKPDGNYKKWPSDMCKARAIARGARALIGTYKGSANIYVKEELEDLDSPSDTAESDRNRADTIAAREDMKVALKPKAEKRPAKSEVVEIKYQPENPTTEAPAEPNTPVPPAEATHTEETPEGDAARQPQNQEPTKYVIHRVFSTGNDKERVLPTEELPDSREEMASIRAQALANENSASFIVFEVSGSGGPRQVGRFDPPKPIKHPDKPRGNPVADSAGSTPTQDNQTTQEEHVLDPRKALIDRLTPLSASLNLNGKTAMARFRAFFSGYFGLGLSELPKNPADYTVAIEELEACISGDALEFSAGPEEAGKRRASWARETRGNLEAQWPNDPKNVSLGVTLARRWMLSPQNFMNWMGQKVIGLTIMPPEDANAYMRLMLATPVSRDGGKLLTCCRKHDISMAKAVEQIESRALNGALELSQEKAVQNAIDAWILNVKEYVGNSSGAAQGPAAKEEDGLFDDLV